ncbi:MAG: hypothetical protein AAGL34_11490 [Bacteroidota bacterium]
MVIPDFNSGRKRDFWIAMAILIGLSSLPFLNELITHEDGSLLNWVASPETQEGWKGENGRILDYSKLRVLLFYLLGHLAIVVASLGWFSTAKNKLYRNALLLCTLSSTYHIFLILSENRKTWLNAPELKLWGTLAAMLVLFAIYLKSELLRRKELKQIQTALGIAPKKIFTLKIVLVWLIFYVISTFPYIHDIIHPRGTGIQDWVPFGGFKEFVELGERNYWGFSSYRALVLTLFMQLLAQIIWAGWWIEAKYSLYKPFLLVPLGLSLYELSMIVMVQQDTFLNKPDLKLVLILGLGAIIGVIYYFKNEAMGKKAQSIKDVVPQTNEYQSK